MTKHSEDLKHAQVPGKGIYRILVCRPNHRLGNTLLLTPLIAELEQRYKGAEIDIISEGDIAKEVFATFFSVKNVFCLPKRGFKHPVSFLRLLFRVRRTSYDLIVDPCIGSGFSRALTKFLKGHYRVGFSDDPKHPGLTHGVPTTDTVRHMAKRAIHLIRSVSEPDKADSEEFPSLDIRLTDDERSKGRGAVLEMLSISPQTAAPPIVGIFANATGAKRYPEAWWKEFIDTFKQLSPRASIVEIIPAHAHSMLEEQWPGYYSSDIRRMGAVMAGTDLIITGDCGVMHLAVASHVTTVGMFCVTDAAVYAPYGFGSRSLSTQGMSAQDAARQIIETYPWLAGPTPAATPTHTSTQPPLARHL